jgi:DNA topoisomerase-2
LYETKSTTNMHMFDADEKLKHYSNVKDIINDYMITRLSVYDDRKKYQINMLSSMLKVLTNKAKYISELLEGTIDLRKKKRDEITNMLMSKSYDMIDGEYKYLLKMPMDSVSEENVEKLVNEKTEREIELNKLKNTSIQKMWLYELNELKLQYSKFKLTREKLQMEHKVKKVKKLKMKKIKKKN